MDSLKRRIKQVYDELGRILDSPQSFGLGEQAPEPLVNAVLAMREKLKAEMIELNQWESENLPAELSRDTA